MAATGISEFTFGYAFLYEQTQRNWSGLRAAPILPSLQKEAGEGWDAHLPLQAADFYYQFKLSEYLTRGNAKYIRDGTYNGSYYRLSLHRRDYNRQHQRLRENCITNPNTYYVAPEFSSAAAFHTSFLAQIVTENSRLIPVSDCDDIRDGDQHYITYRQGLPAWRQHSEPKPHGRSHSGKDIESLYRESQSSWKAVDTSFAEGLFARTVSVVKRQLDKEHRPADVLERRFLEPPMTKTRRAFLLRTADLLSVYCGATLVLVGLPPVVPPSRTAI